MEILILDPLLRPIDVVDVFSSMIWTERFSSRGDFELTTISSPENLKRFVTNTLLMVTGSKRIMKIETVEDSIDEESRRVLKVKGTELVSLLEGRTALEMVFDVGVMSSWIIEDMKPADIMRHIVKKICVDGTLAEYDKIPFLQWGETLYTTNTIPEPEELISWEQKPDSVYAAISEIADIYDLGFRMYKDPNASKLYFDVYAGSDRTTIQTELDPVIFSPDMENLQNTTEFNDVSKYFNVVRVMFSRTVDDTEEIFTLEVSENDVIPPEGFDRRVKMLTVSSIPEDVLEEDIPAYLYRAGLDELMKSRPLGAFDGEVSRVSQYVYERDYFLGDLVEIRTGTGGTAFMRVEEYIFVQDTEGERSYPTLTTKRFINPGTWLSWKYDVEWTAMGPEEYWANQ